MARIDVTQPQYWVLNCVHSWPAAPSREDVAARLTPLADGPYEIPRVVGQLLHRGWLHADADGRLHLTGAGEAARVRLRALVTEVRAVVHEGVGDEEYVAALKVLRTMVANVQRAEARVSVSRAAAGPGRCGPARGAGRPPPGRR